MTLVKCKDCGKDVSYEAKSCPNCGSPISQRWRIAVAIPLYVIGVVLFYKIGEILYHPILGIVLGYLATLLVPYLISKIIGENPYWREAYKNSRLSKK